MSKERTPEEILKRKKIGKIIASSIVVLVAIFGLLVIAFARQLFGDKVGDALFGEGVPNGFVALGNILYENISNVISTLVAICVIIVISSILGIILALTLRKNAKAKTVGSLLQSLLKYVSVIVAIFVILGIWGVNVAAILASIGVIALIITLGCKTLINDIVSGFFIVVDDYYKVGDRITVDGFTGDVISVGLRATKIMSWDGNIKSINNSSITTIVNLSEKESYALVYYDISYDEDLRRVEAVIARNLGSLKAKIPQIIEGPFYKGIDEFESSNIRLFFYATCSEFDKYPIQRALRREIYLMFKDNNVDFSYNQLVVSNPEERKIDYATEEDKEISNKLMHPNDDEYMKKLIDPKADKESKKKSIFD